MNKGKVISNIVQSQINDLSIEDLYSYLAIFDSKGWNKKGLRYKDTFCFDRFCARASLLKNQNEKELFLDLSNRFDWIDESQWNKFLSSSLLKIKKHRCNYSVLPLARSKDYKERKKSGFFVLDEFAKIMITHQLSYKGNSFQFPNINSLEEIQSKVFDDYILLVDDFIGSGTSVLECVEDINKYKKVKIEVLVMAGMEEGIEKVESKGIKVYSDYVLGKGISDFYKAQELFEKVSVMQAIEKRLNVKDGYSFGRYKSESLICFRRAANNTFPVFWAYSINGGIPGPFLRTRT